MADYPGSNSCRAAEEESAASVQLKVGRDSAGDAEHGASPEPADSSEAEIESLKRKWALYQKELNAVDEQAAAIERESQALVESIQRESQTLAESIRREAEAKAREIIRRATAEAELQELRARVRAEAMRAMVAARLLTHLGPAVEAAQVGGDMAVPNQVAPVPPHDDEREAIDSTGTAEEAGEARTSSAAATGPRPDDEKAASAEGDSGPAMPVAASESAVGSVNQAPQHDDRQAISGDEHEMAEETGEAGTSEVAVEGDKARETKGAGAEPGSGSASAASTAGEGVPDVTTRPPRVELRRYRVRGPLNSDSMAAVEQAVGRIPGVVSAKVNLSPDGAGILTVSSHDLRSTELEIRKLHI